MGQTRIKDAKGKYSRMRKWECGWCGLHIHSIHIPGKMDVYVTVDIPREGKRLTDYTAFCDLRILTNVMQS